MENKYIHRNQSHGVAHSPRMLRSKSGAQNMKALSSPLTPKTILPRSKSTTKERLENIDGILGRSNRFHTAAKPVDMTKSSKKIRSGSSSPSAWALSPGRSPRMDTSKNSNTAGKVKSSGGGGLSVTGVLRYFRPKKVCTLEEEAFHRYGVLHTRLVQWRFVNSRAEAAIARRNAAAQEKLFNVWLRNFQMRSSMVEKRILLQKLKHERRLRSIVNPELQLLKEWRKIEKRNGEAVRKLARKLSTLSIRLPLIEGVKANMISVYNAMSTAMDLMSSIEETISKAFFQVKETSLMLKELMLIVVLERGSLEEVRKTIELVAPLKVQEESLRVYLIQIRKCGAVY